ncbi:GNAT family N-acetyltransferase [uncultured Sphingomonas sp.]|uniref:GNAT family N-acetyltransferase n=1 Tax=uncultured Sphingomonas sp. TaxID=158754 RepID=UPI0035CA0672
MITLRQDDPTSPAVADLLAAHVAFGRAGRPAENAHVLGADGLSTPTVTFWTAWEGTALAGFAALKELEPTHGEVKSMRTAPTFLRRGVARLLLDHIAATARTRGYRRISLETGSGSAFGPAIALYQAFGFVDGPVFGGYPPSPHNRFMTLLL